MTLRTLALPWLLGWLFVAPAGAASRPAAPTASPAQGAKAQATKQALGKKKASTKKKRAVGQKKARAKAPPVAPVRGVLPATRGGRVAHRAVELIGRPLAAYGVPDDCSGLVRLAYRSVGVELMSIRGGPGENAASVIYRRAERAGALHRHLPQAGDLVFFRETYDRNGDGLRNDGLTHVAVVEGVEPGGTVVFVHRGGAGVKRSRMNLRAPRSHGVRGRVLNDYLRRAGDGERARLTGELFVSYASAARL